MNRKTFGKTDQMQHLDRLTWILGRRAGSDFRQYRLVELLNEFEKSVFTMWIAWQEYCDQAAVNINIIIIIITTILITGLLLNVHLLMFTAAFLSCKFTVI